ncbi:MAG TPA: hypothetical protein VHY82_01700 [Acetobacteraceae bacterium]|jgi:hypothetical protein|nr:hypothetical protein [Acetobacteraceae bacterium]
MISRRYLLAALSAIGAGAAIRPAASATAKVLRLGFQKGEAVEMAGKQNRGLAACRIGAPDGAVRG